MEGYNGEPHERTKAPAIVLGKNTFKGLRERGNQPLSTGTGQAQEVKKHGPLYRTPEERSGKNPHLIKKKKTKKGKSYLQYARKKQHVIEVPKRVLPEGGRKIFEQ